jgi:hypothetical protein
LSSAFAIGSSNELTKGGSAALHMSPTIYTPRRMRLTCEARHFNTHDGKFNIDTINPSCYNQPAFTHSEDRATLESDLSAG